ncbi:transcriptional regulator [Nocardiopsis sp. NPDC006832]|uniref:transcriptional regulator n=1 Tax=Nocardiopsis sp. NPDC006832 TaxID=3157188 RepID=UPI0033F487F9
MNSLPELDPVIHAQARLRVMVSLQELPYGDQMKFSRLQQLLGMTAGNLSVHIRKLEDANYVDVLKTHHKRAPVTYLSLTKAGRRALEAYVDTLRDLLDGTGPGPKTPRK